MATLDAMPAIHGFDSTSRCYMALIQRAGVLKTKSDFPKVIKDWHDSLLADYRKFFPIIFSWCPEYGYTTIQDNKPVFVSPEERIESIRKEAKEHLNEVLAFGKMIGSKGVGGSSSYAIFYKHHKNNENGAYTPSRAKFMKEGIHNRRVELVDALMLNAIPDKEWIRIAQEVVGYSEDRLKLYWNKFIAKRVVSHDRKLGKIVREKYLEPKGLVCAQPENSTYCRVLTEIIKRQLHSQIEKSKFHEEELKSIEKTVSEFDSPLLDVICQYAEELNQINSGLSKYVIKNAVKEVISPPEKQSEIYVQSQVLSQEKYKPLVNATIKEILSGYEQWKVKSRYENRLKNRKYVLYPKLSANYKIPIGQNSLGRFKINVSENGEIVIRLNNMADVVCMPSKYFFNLKSSPVVDKKKQLVGYQISFNHNSRRKEPTEKPDFNGIVKEIGLQLKDDGRFYITLPYCMEYSNDNFDLIRPLLTSSPTEDQIKKMPSEFNVVGFDLNLSMPLPITRAIVGKSVKGEINVEYLGQAKVIESTHLIYDNNRCKVLIAYKRQCDLIKRAIREWKICKGKNIDISEKTYEWLESHTKRWNPSRQPESMQDRFSVSKMRIQILVNKAKSRIAKYNDNSWKTGHGNESELIRLIDADDAYNSLVSTYNRIHLKSNQFIYALPSKNNSRSNKKEYCLRRIAAKIARYCHLHNVNICIGENLSFQQDSDNISKDNSLVRLFSSKSIASYMKLAMEKFGIAFIDSADPSGTSKTDPVTGNIGYRNKFDKRKLHVLRNGNWGWVDSDIAASLNILIRGINRSIVPYKFFVGKKKQESKRLNHFLNKIFGTTKVFFYEDQFGFANPSLSKKEGENLIANQYLYYREGKFVTQKIHRQIEDDFKKIDFSNTSEVNLIPSGVKLKNFQFE